MKMNVESETALNSEKGGPSSVSTRTALAKGSIFKLDSRFHITGILGQGAYGVVVSVEDTHTGQKLAVKKMENVFKSMSRAKRTLRELKTLRLLDQENLLGIQNIQLPSTPDDVEELYVFQELFDADLSTVIKGETTLTDSHVQFMLYQILRGIKYMHSADIIHRDLKPRNIFVNKNCDLVVGDFGLTRKISKGNAVKMSDYVATRWYRAPELVFQMDNYSFSSDMWSVGCIFAELLGRYPMFPGSSFEEQVMLIIDQLGSPPQHLVDAIQKDKIKSFVESQPQRQARSLAAQLPGQNPLAIDLLSKMLCLDPLERITAEEALRHPYLANLHLEEDEPVATKPISDFDFLFDSSDVTIEDMMGEIMEEIKLYHYQGAEEEYRIKQELYESLFPTSNSFASTASNASLPCGESSPFNSGSLYFN